MNSRVRWIHWHAAVCAVIALALASSMVGVTVKLRSGKQVVGSVIDKNDTNIVLKTTEAGTNSMPKTAAAGTNSAPKTTAAGTNSPPASRIVTIAWRDVTTESLKALHPDLYARLKEKADERAKKKAEEAQQIEETMRAQGKVLVNGKWLTQAEAQLIKLRRISLIVNTREANKTADRHTDYSSGHSREKDTTLQCWGEVVVKITGLDPETIHTLKINGTHYRRGDGYSYSDSYSSTNSGSYSSGRNATFEQEETLTGKGEKNLVVKTAEYERTKMVSFSTYSGSSKSVYGLKSDGFDVNITIDGVLIYEQKKRDAAKYYHVGNR